MAIPTTDPIRNPRGDSLSVIVPLLRYKGEGTEPLPVTEYSWSLVDDVTYGLIKNCIFRPATPDEIAYSALKSNHAAADHGWLYVFVPGSQNPAAPTTNVYRLRSLTIAEPANDYKVRLRMTVVDE